MKPKMSWTDAFGLTVQTVLLFIAALMMVVGFACLIGGSLYLLALAYSALIVTLPLYVNIILAIVAILALFTVVTRYCSDDDF